MTRSGLFAVLVLVLAAPAAFAQSRPEYVPLGRANGAIYRPDTGPMPHIAFLVAHRTANNLNNIACKELAKRGFVVLCFNTRYENNEAQVRWETEALDVKAAYERARAEAGITKVILWGHSGGSPLMTLYQAVAENGVAYCQAPERIVKCGANLAGLRPADGIVLADAHPGNPIQVMRSLNPSVAMEHGERRVIADLDPFAPENGYNPDGPSHYSQDFKTRYYAAQAERMTALLKKAEDAQARMKTGDYPYPDDDILLIPAGGNPGAGAGGDANLATLDPDVPGIMETARPEKLLRNDGTIVTEVIHSVSVAEPSLAKTNRAFDTGTKIFTIKSFLSANATRATNALDGIDYCSSNNSTTCAVGSIRVPMMIAAMGGYHFVRDQEIIYDRAASKDKDYIVVEGALHGYTPCTRCEKTPGQYANSVKNLFDYVAAWTNKRF